MSDLFKITLEVGLHPAPAVINQLIRHAEMPGAHIDADTAHGIHCNHRLGARLLQRPEIGAVVDLVRRNPMRPPMPGQKQHFATGKVAAHDCCRRNTVRCSAAADFVALIEPIKLAPITVVPDLKEVAQTVDFESIIGALTRLSQGVKVNVATSDAPLSIALGKIPVDLSISVSSPTQETVFKVEIKGTIGE